MPASSSTAGTRPTPAPADTTPDWRHAAACRQVAPETFFPAAETGDSYDEQVAAAKAVCRSCRVLTQCRGWALAHLSYGVAGGLTDKERSTLRRRQNRANQSAAEPTRTGPAGDVPSTATRSERRAAAVGCIAEGRTSRDQAARQFRVSTRTIDRWLAAARATA